MHPFTIETATDVPAAIRFLANHPSAKIMAGGTNLIDLMKMYVEKPEQLLDIQHLDLQKIEPLSNGGIRIGAGVRNSDLAYNAEIAMHYPLLSQALLAGASPQIRNMATVGGNLLQRTRCPYFFNASFPCNKRAPGSGCPAIHGYNRSHAILGTSGSCIATHPSDMCVALVALGAIVITQGPRGQRQIPMEDFHTLPEAHPEKENTLDHAELITAIDLPAAKKTLSSCYLKVRDRASYEFALASAGIILDVQGGIIASARVALGGVATKPWRARGAEAILTGSANNSETYRRAAEASVQNAAVRTHNAFKIELTRRVVVRALETAGAAA